MACFVLFLILLSLWFSFIWDIFYFGFCSALLNIYFYYLFVCVCVCVCLHAHRRVGRVEGICACEFEELYTLLNAKPLFRMFGIQSYCLYTLSSNSQSSYPASQTLEFQVYTTIPEHSSSPLPPPPVSPPPLLPPPLPPPSLSETWSLWSFGWPGSQYIPG